MYSYLEDVNGGFLIYTKDLDYFKSLEGIDFFWINWMRSWNTRRDWKGIW